MGRTDTMTSGSPELAKGSVRMGAVPDEIRPPATFIIGPARSGTSLLYKALCLHPDAAFISNWLARCPSVAALAALNRFARGSSARARRHWFWDDANAYVYGRQ